MGNLLNKKKEYQRLTFAPYIDENDNIIESSLEYHEYDDIQGLQAQIDNIKKHYNRVLDVRISNIENDIKQIKNVFSDINTKINNLKELSDMQSRDLESLLGNDNLLLARISLLEEKVKYDEFVNSNVSDENFKSIVDQ